MGVQPRVRQAPEASVAVAAAMPLGTQIEALQADMFLFTFPISTCLHRTRIQHSTLHALWMLHDLQWRI